MQNKLSIIEDKLQTLALFRPLLAQQPLSSFVALLGEKDEARLAGRYSEFVACLYQQKLGFSEWVLQQALQMDHLVIRQQSEGKTPSGVMMESLWRELEILQQASAVTPEKLIGFVMVDIPLPKFETAPLDFAAAYQLRMEKAPKEGVGVFASGHMLALDNNGELLAVEYPDPQTLEELTGYKNEREKVLVNTQALLKGLPANNILLYGDAGTGKSSTVKAVANRFKNDGLRLVEIRKHQLYLIPELMGRLARVPLRFVLFIDDLSFAPDDGDFTALKAILEGTVSARPDNIVVYATSNRRHMVRERFSDRQGDDLHVADTLEEASSLAARFGITITFLRPDRDLYHEIVVNFAKEMKIQMPTEELLAGAEAFALRNGGRSPRTARQFTEFTKAQQVAVE